METVLIVTEDDQLAQTLSQTLESQYAVWHTHDWWETDHHIQSIPIAAVVLDATIPGAQTIHRRLRIYGPVLVVVPDINHELIQRFHGQADIVAKTGAGSPALRKRIQDLTTQSDMHAPPTVAWGDLHINVARQTVAKHGATIPLTPTEWAVLHALIAAEGTPLSWQRLRIIVWGNAYQDPSIVRAYIRALRRKLEDDPTHPQFILQAQRGQGYYVPQVISPTSDPPAHSAAPFMVPAPRSRIIGRDDILHDLAARLRNPVQRLITLIGPPGIGKTRLALAVAEQVHGQFTDGIFFIALETIHDTRFVLPTLAHFLGITESPNRGLHDHLGAWLQDKQLLLILDNCEQVAAAGSLFAHLLDRASRVTMLLTSREPLNLYAEQRIMVPPLSPPAYGHTNAQTLEDLQTNPAVTLFLDRAHWVSPALQLTSETAPRIAHICTILDGIPLDIELAAARCDRMDLHSLERALQSTTRLTLLADGPLERPARQRSTFDAIAWSYDLLPPTAQQILRACSVFAQGCSRDALQALIPTVSLATIQILVSKNLLYVDPARPQQWQLLERVRVFAEAMAKDRYELPTWQAAHTRYYGDLVQQAEAGLIGAQREHWIGILHHELPNLRQALQWSLTHEPQRFFRCVSMLWKFWLDSGFLDEGHYWLTLAHEHIPAYKNRDPTLYANVLHAVGSMEGFGLGHVATALPVLEECLRMRTTVGDDAQTAKTLLNLGTLVITHDPRAAEQWLQDCLQICQRHPDQPAFIIMLADVANSLGMLVSERGDIPTARDLFQTALATYRASSEERSVALVLNNLATLAYTSQHYHEAQTFAQQSMEQYQALPENTGGGQASAQVILALSATDLGDFSTAAVHLRTALTLYADIDDPRGSIEALEATLYLLTHDPNSTAHLRRDPLPLMTLWEASIAQRQYRGLPMTVDEERRATGIQQYLTTTAQPDYQPPTHAQPLVPLYTTLTDALHLMSQSILTLFFHALFTFQ